MKLATLLEDDGKLKRLMLQLQQQLIDLFDLDVELHQAEFKELKSKKPYVIFRLTGFDDPNYWINIKVGGLVFSWGTIDAADALERFIREIVRPDGQCLAYLDYPDNTNGLKKYGGYTETTMEHFKGLILWQVFLGMVKNRSGVTVRSNDSLHVSVSDCHVFMNASAGSGGDLIFRPPAQPEAVKMSGGYSCSGSNFLSLEACAKKGVELLDALEAGKTLPDKPYIKPNTVFA